MRATALLLDQFLVEQLTGSAGLNPRFEVSLVSRRHRYSTLKQLGTEPESFAWKSDCLRVLLLTMHYGPPLPWREVVLYGRRSNKLSRLLLRNVPLLDTVMSIHAFAKISGDHYCISFRNF